MVCDGQQCYTLLYEAKVINLHDFRIARLYMPGRSEPSGCTTPTESETRELMERLEKFVVKKLDDEATQSKCPDGYNCVFNGRFSEWSEWVDYPDEIIEITAHTTRHDLVCEWRVSGVVKIRFRKKLGDCFRRSLFKSSF